MQTFSDMQRNRSDIQNIKFFVFYFTALIYEIFTGVSMFLPPFIGVVFCYLTIHKYKRNQILHNLGYRWYLSLFFLVFVEQINGFELFSSVIAFFVFFYVFVEYFILNIKSKQILFFILVICAYISIFSVSNLISYIENENLLSFTYEYILYIVIDTVITSFIYKDRKI